MQENDPNSGQSRPASSDSSSANEEDAIQAAMFDNRVEIRGIQFLNNNDDNDDIQVSSSISVIPTTIADSNASAPLANLNSSPSSFSSNRSDINSSSTHSQIVINVGEPSAMDFNVPSVLQAMESAAGKSAFDWAAYESRAEILQRLKAERKFVDVELIAEDGQSELVHSVVMSALGDRLSSCILPQRDDPSTPCIRVPCLTDQQMVSHVKQIRLNGISGQVLKTLVDCAYTGHVRSSTVSEDNGLSSSTSAKHQLIWSILHTAEQFAIHELVFACCTHLIFQLDVDNCVRLLQLGLRCGHRLRTAAWNFLKINFDQVFHECSDFCQLQFEQLDSLLDDDQLNVQTGEQLIWEAIRRWILIDPQNRAVYLNRLLSRIRFGRLPINYVTEHMLSDPLLSQLAVEAELQSSSINHESTATNKTTISNNSSTMTSKGISNNKTHPNHCIRLLQQMNSVRRNDSGQYRQDNHGLLIGLSPQLIRPRVPAEVLFAIGGWLEGVPTTLIETYDVRTDQWFECAMFHKQPRAYHGIEVLDGLCYLVGGTNGTEILSSVHCFDPCSGRWFERANMYEQRCYVSTSTLNGFMYAMGGHNGLQRVRSVERYDPKTNQWTQLPQMNLARSDASATVFEGRIYIAGGLNDQVMENSVEMFNPAENNWTFIQPMSSARTSFSLCAYGNCLYALGGNNGFERLATVEKYDFHTRLWSSVEPMASRRSTFTACVLEDRLYVIGGYNGHTPINLVEAFDRRTGRWSSVCSIKHDRSGLAVCVLRGLSNAVDYTYIGMTAKKFIKQNLASNTNSKVNNNSVTTDNENLMATEIPSSKTNATVSVPSLRSTRFRLGTRYRRRMAAVRNAENNRRSTSLSQAIVPEIVSAFRPVGPTISSSNVLPNIQHLNSDPSQHPLVGVVGQQNSTSNLSLNSGQQQLSSQQQQSTQSRPESDDSVRVGSVVTRNHVQGQNDPDVNDNN